MLLRDDKETEEIGKLIAAGHPELAARTFVSRFRHRTVTRLGIAVIGLLSGTGALVHWLG